jgi:hypothetical protein
LPELQILSDEVGGGCEPLEIPGSERCLRIGEGERAVSVAPDPARVSVAAPLELVA